MASGVSGRVLNDSSWLFNLGADVYAWFTAQAAWRGSCARMADLVQNGEHQDVVDLGCGPGVSTFALARRLPSTRLVGMDVAPRMLREARRRSDSSLESPARIRWLLADAARMPIASQSVDVCTGHSFLYLVADRSLVLKEIRRILRPGGRLVLMEPNARGATVQQVFGLSHDPRHLVSVSLWRPFSRLHGRFTASTLSATLEAAGFRHCAVEETLAGLGLLAQAQVAT